MSTESAPVSLTECPQEAGFYQPVVDRNRCEGKGDCVAVCPADVFEVGRITDDDFAALSFIGKLKNRAHGRKTAYMPNIDACQACASCVSTCPEKAIRLARRTFPGSSSSAV